MPIIVFSTQDDPVPKRTVFVPATVNLAFWVAILPQVVVFGRLSVAAMAVAFVTLVVAVLVAGIAGVVFAVVGVVDVVLTLTICAVGTVTLAVLAVFAVSFAVGFATDAVLVVGAAAVVVAMSALPVPPDCASALFAWEELAPPPQAARARPAPTIAIDWIVKPRARTLIMSVLTQGLNATANPARVNEVAVRWASEPTGSV